MATAKKTPNSSYTVQLTLSEKEARFIQLVVGRTTHSGDFGLSVYSSLKEVNGDWANDDCPPNFTNYNNYSKLVRDWVENEK